MLTLNLNLLYTVVNILVLFLLLRKFLYKPVMNIIAQRQKQVDDALNAAETSKKEAAAAMNAAQDKLRNVDTEAAARRETYEQQAETAKQHLAGLGQPAQGVIDLQLVRGAVHLGAVAGGQDGGLGMARVALAQAVQRGCDLVERKCKTAPQVKRCRVVVESESPDAHNP